MCSILQLTCFLKELFIFTKEKNLLYSFILLLTNAITYVSMCFFGILIWKDQLCKKWIKILASNSKSSDFWLLQFCSILPKLDIFVKLAWFLFVEAPQLNQLKSKHIMLFNVTNLRYCFHGVILILTCSLNGLGNTLLNHWL